MRARGAPVASYIALQPLPRESPSFVDGSLQFTLLLSAPSSAGRRPGMEGATSPVHSYPPTPSATTPTFTLQPPSPRAVGARLAQLSAPSASTPTPSRPANFVLVPTEDEIPPTASLFARALGVIKRNTRGPSCSFALRTANPPGAPLSPTTPATASTAGPSPTSADPLAGWNAAAGEDGNALVEYRDTTGAFRLAASSGVLEVDAVLARKLGVPVGLCVALALAYLEFLGEREVSIFT